ncbi:MAG TPA: hypothetical protein VKY37_10550 [Brumimicrobium sp.]|nr:hypothetical protein [Brumimicrobium sp.]
MNKFWIVLLFLQFPLYGLTQEKLALLPPQLVESSALIKHKSNFITINDSGNKPELYVFNQKGDVIHTCYIKNAQNIDWEALAYDGQTYLYIGDIGNNNNKRKDLSIYKVKLEDALDKDTINAQKISFSYPEQYLFPPYKSNLYYDAEALIVKDNQLLIFTKNRTVPFDGISKVYALPTESGEYQASLQKDLKLLPTNWREESITDATYYNGELYILTYSKIYMFIYENDNWVQKKEYLHDSWTQKEGIAVDKRYIYLTDENPTGIFSHNYLYKLKK